MRQEKREKTNNKRGKQNAKEKRKPMIANKKCKKKKNNM